MPLFSIPLSGLTASSTAMSAIANKQVNHPTAGRVPNGGLVERDTSLDLRKLATIALLAREPDFRTTRDMAAAINHEAGGPVATAIDGRRAELSNLPPAGIPELLARLLGLKVEIHPHAKVVVSERTGTIVMGRDVRLTAVSILHGDLTVEISTEYQVSQPAPFSQGQTATVPQTTVEAKEEKVKHIELREGASVQQLVEGLQAIGATARDVVAILQAIKAAGALQAELEVI
jgi:flagellar P-ring protein precursor FlgI